MLHCLLYICIQHIAKDEANLMLKYRLLHATSFKYSTHHSYSKYLRLFIIYCWEVSVFLTKCFDIRFKLTIQWYLSCTGMGQLGISTARKDTTSSDWDDCKAFPNWLIFMKTRQIPAAINNKPVHTTRHNT